VKITDTANISSTPRIDRVQDVTHTKLHEASGPAGDLGLSPDSAEVSSLSSKALAAAGTPEERLAELKKLYTEGRYHVDARKLSAKIVDSMLNK
jgi:anti-sigma28 factor (negative regulator of flagellin synthesis)